MPNDGDVLIETVGVLVMTLRELGTGGRPVAASRLAARAWWVLKVQNLREAEHINELMHFLGWSA